MDNEWRKLRYDTDQANKTLNQINQVIAQKKKDSKGADPCIDEIAKSKEVDSQREALEKKEKDFYLLLEKKVNSVGNLVHDSVPIEKNEDFNKVERTWG